MSDNEKLPVDNLSNEELSSLIKANQLNAYIIRTMSGLKMDDESKDEVALYNSIKDNIKTNIPISKEYIDLYIPLFTFGYDTFGAEYFTKLMEVEPAHLFTGIVAFIELVNSLPEETLEKMKENYNKNA